MGFEKIESGSKLSPISGVMDLPIPKSLSEAAGSVCDKGTITECNDQGISLAKKQAGKPKRKIDPQHYGAIMLYTSNAIYTDLNKCLRDENRGKIKKYFKYLRLLLDAMSALPQQKRTLWRGVSANLFANPQYAVGKTLTWWGVSSCTADKKVATGFAGSCGGDATVITVEAKTSCDIQQVSFYGSEKECLLAPGTQFKVKSKSKKGNVAEITLEEVGRAIA